jgi:hypothetical protein
MNAWRNRDPGYQGRRQSTTTISKASKEEEGEEIQQRGLAGTRSASD